MVGVRNSGSDLRRNASLGNRATQRRLSASLVANIVLMLVLVLCLTFGGFLYMDYKTEEARAKKMDKRVAELRRQFEEGCNK
jgi:hypothetical protein